MSRQLISHLISEKEPFAPGGLTTEQAVRLISVKLRGYLLVYLESLRHRLAMLELMHVGCHTPRHENSSCSSAVPAQCHF